MMWSAGSSPAYSGRIWRIRSFNVVIEYSHPILSAMTVAGIRGKLASNFRTSVSTASTNEPRLLRSYFGGRSDASAARTVLRAMPNRLTISLVGSALTDATDESLPSSPLFSPSRGSYRGVGIQTTPRG
jgi:hypothetical protein